MLKGSILIVGVLSACATSFLWGRVMFRLSSEEWALCASVVGVGGAYLVLAATAFRIREGETTTILARMLFFAVATFPGVALLQAAVAYALAMWLHEGREVDKIAPLLGLLGAVASAPLAGSFSVLHWLGMNSSDRHQVPIAHSPAGKPNADGESEGDE